MSGTAPLSTCVEWLLYQIHCACLLGYVDLPLELCLCDYWWLQDFPIDGSNSLVSLTGRLRPRTSFRQRNSASGQPTDSGMEYNSRINPRNLVFEHIYNEFRFAILCARRWRWTMMAASW